MTLSPRLNHPQRLVLASEVHARPFMLLEAPARVSHLAVHATVPTWPELRRMAGVSFGAFGAVVLPLVFIAFAALGTWSIDAALRASTIALTVTLIAIGFLAVRRVKMEWWQRLIALGAEFAVGAAVVALELLAHG